MSALHVEVDEAEGRAVADIVLIHGWGLHGGVWDEVAADLTAAGFRVWRVDLPGHGASPFEAVGQSAAGPQDYSLGALAAAVVGALAGRLPGPAWWLGWSLGGLVALQVALDHSDRVAGLVTVATTPRFAATSDWECAVDPEVLAGFASDLARDYRATLLRFLALQARGGEHAREDVRRLRERVFARGEPNRRALRGGLDILAQTDLRPRLAEVAVPVLALGGERDTLVPPAAISALAEALPHGQAVIIRGAGHAPFISDRKAFVTTVKRFIHARH